MKEELLPLFASKVDWKEPESFEKIYGLVSEALKDHGYFVYKLWENQVVAKRAYEETAGSLFVRFPYTFEGEKIKLGEATDVEQRFVPATETGIERGLSAVREVDNLSTDDPKFIESVMEEDDDGPTPDPVIESLQESEKSLREKGEFEFDYFDSPLTEAKIELITEGKNRHHVIRNASMLSEFSANGRRYSSKVQEEALSLMEGAKAYADHPTKANENEARRVKDAIGRYKNVRFDMTSNKTFGDLHLVPTTLVTEYIVPMAESDPGLIGASINAFGKMDSKGNVEKITRVRSVDIVTEPATTKSLYESVEKKESNIEKGEKTMTMKIEEVLADEDLMGKLREHIHEEIDVVASVQEKDDKIKEQEDKIKALEEDIAKGKIAEQARNTQVEIDTVLNESKLPDEAKKELRGLLDKAASSDERKQLVKRMEDMLESVKKTIKAPAPSVHTDRTASGQGLNDKDLTNKVFESFRYRTR